MTELQLEIDGAKFAGLRWPRAGAEPVIALHGWLDNAATWSRLLPRLDCYDVFALDLAGHGKSDHRPATTAYHFIDNVADVVRVADALGWERFGLLGHSLGASVATLVAGTVPERISSLVCIEGFGPLTTPAAEAPAQLAKSLARYRDGTGVVRRFTSIEEAARARSRATKVSQSVAQLLSERGTCIDDGAVVWSSDPRLRYDSPMRLSEDQACAFISHISAPVLLIRGRQGMDYVEQTYRRRAAACPHLETVVVEGGHHLHVEPETVAAVADAITSFRRA